MTSKIFALGLLLVCVLKCALSLSLEGADISSLPLVESQGVTFTDSGVKKPFETILTAHGANAARIRVWTAGTYTQAYALSLAKRVKAAGMSLIIDLHFSDTWADPGHQAIPASWPTDLASLNTEIYNYTRDLVSAFNNQGTPIDFLEVGNEINDGLLWPTGRISVNGFKPASELLHSAIQGARVSSSSLKTIIHIANGWDSSGVQYFFNGIFTPGALSTNDVNVFAFSFYPFYGVNATFDNLSSSLKSITSKYGKEVLVIETNWPFSCSSVALSEPSIPVSASGQLEWVSQIKGVLEGLPNNLGIGIAYWEPGWVGSASLGSSCSDNLLVNESGQTRSSIDIFH